MSQAIKGVPFERFIESPTPKRFRELQQAVVAGPDYNPTSNDLRRLGQQYHSNRFESVLMVSEMLYPQWQLSPMFHYLVGNAALEVGEASQAEFEQHASRICLDQLLASGDGTAESPYRVTYRSDAQDIALAVEFDVRCQQLVETDDDRCDVLTAHDGEELWFSVEAILSQVAKAQNVA